MLTTSEKSEIINLFKFLKQYNNVKNPIVTDIVGQSWYKWMDNISEHENIQNNIKGMEEDNNAIFTISKPELKECPNPPEEIKEWLKKGWNRLSEEVSIKENIEKLEINSNDSDEVIVIINFYDDKNRVSALEEWKQKRELWLKKEIESRKVDELFNSFYSLYSTLKKESENLELVLGDGILSYNGIKKIYHPILLQKVNLKFDTNVPKFKIEISDKSPEIYKSMFTYVSESNSELLLEIYKEFEEEEFSPCEVSESSSFLNRVAHALSSNGKFIDIDNDSLNIEDYPQIFRKPVLFIRKRNMGFGSAIDSIIEDLEDVETIPQFLKDIVGIDDTEITTNNSGINESNILNSNGIDEDILLTKPSNMEQLAVAKYLDRNGAVLVQGPPGTGKTHTIANMIGHLLSQGKSILVTSYSEKALSVLKEKVVDNLQALCLSLLSTTESRAEMEKTLDIINENRSTLEIESLQRRIVTLEKERKEKINKLNEFKLNLKNARLNEYRPIVIGGDEYKPKDSAKFINEHKENDSWIPLPIVSGANLSLSEQEISELYLSNESITKYEEFEYDCNLPELNELITPIEFNKLITRKSTFNNEILEYGLEFWKSKADNITVEKLNDIKNGIESAVNSIDIDKLWTLEIIENSKQNDLKKNWVNLINEIDNVYKLSISCSEQIINYNPKFIDLDISIDAKQQLEAIIEKLESGGKISRFNLLMNKSMKNLINSCMVNGHVPNKSNEYKALIQYYELTIGKERLKNRWNRQMTSLGADSIEIMGKDFELTCVKYLPIIKANINWYEDIWNPIEQQLKDIGIEIIKLQNKVDLSSDKFSDLKFIKIELSKKITEIVDSEICRIHYEEIKNNKEKVENIVSKYSINNNSKIINELQSAVINEDIELYKECYESIKAIRYLEKNINRRRELINKLEKTAPTWANQIRLRKNQFGESVIPADVKSAWRYAQFKQEIEKRNRISIENLQNDILETEKALREDTADLAFDKAWVHKLLDFNNNKAQVRAIEGWRQIIRKIGAGKGKNAERLKVEARKLMPQCQGAVPVWIMPLNKVVENFNPKENKFDVVIIDEASQADVMAIVALYLGKQVIIVGDNEQVSPLAIGEKSDDIERLTREYLRNIPHPSLYSGKFSIYDLAQTAGYQPVRLKEHFRCVPEIIQYSNMLSYNGQIKALRETSEVKTKPSIITYRVENAAVVNKTNQKEIETVVSLILSCCEQKEYEGKTFGVITLRGERQATLIDRMLQNKMDAKEYNNRNILCGNPANFQGDERDIIFLSMVDANDKEGPMRLTSYGTDDLYKKRYNVAVSRAKDQLCLVYSMDSNNDLKSGDIRKGLIDYCKNYKSRQIEYDKNVAEAESEFEKRVMKYLIERGYNITPQWKVGSVRIDMVATYKGNKVAIECDGERWHGEDKLEEDMNRQAILERLGWRFIRIRGSEFFSDEASAMKRVTNKLDELGIYIEEKNNNINEENLLKDNIINRAQEIRLNWDIAKGNND